MIRDLLKNKAIEKTIEGYEVLAGGNERINKIFTNGLLQGGIYTTIDSIKNTPVSSKVILVSGSMIIIKPMKYFFSFQNYELVEKLGNKENDFELLTYNPETDSYIK